MGKIMTEADYKRLQTKLDELINQSLVFEGSKTKPKQSNAGINTAKGDIEKYMQKLAKTTNSFGDIARRIGLNPDSYGSKNYEKEYQKGFQQELGKSLIQTYNPEDNTLTTKPNPEVTEEILQAAERIKKYITNTDNTKAGGTVNWDAFKKDPDYNYLMRMKDLMDIKGLSQLYDTDSPKTSKPNEYGLSGKNPSFNYTQVPPSTKSFGGDILKYWASKLAAFTKAKYGLQIKIPGDIFPSGNDKLPPSTLVINFNSAIRCPAWNECLVKYACYARSGEKRTGNNVGSFPSNTNKNLLWELTHGDTTMLQLMMNLVKSYLFNYEGIFNQASETLKRNKIKDISSLLSLELDNELVTGELFNVFKNNQKANAVRLNEDGDFLGQWLVDAWDEFGGKAKAFGIIISAYTCRNLNFEGVKNIVLNSSNIANKNVDRYFIALSEEVYNSFDDTYDGFDEQTGKLSIILKPLGDYDELGNWKPNGKFYYKCPCNIEEVMGPKVKNKTKSEDYDCYKCEVCYTPNNLSNQPYYVFVKVHGESNIGNFKDRKMKNIGFSEHYLENIQKSGIAQSLNETYESYQEDENIDLNTNQAFSQITRNAVLTMNRRFASYGSMLEEERSKIEETFKKTLDRINNVEF